MSQDEIKGMDKPTNYKKRKTVMDDYTNIIYKMLRDNMDCETIYAYVRYKGYNGSSSSLADYIRLIQKNNMPKKTRFHPLKFIEKAFPDDVTVIKRSSLLKYLLTINPKKEKNETIDKNIEAIKNKYPIADEVQTIFKSFHSVIMGKDTDALDTFIEAYKDSKAGAFCDGLKKDIDPVKNAISFDVSSGFVEGNNNKFKLIKRILYGRAGLVNLSKKCFLAFSLNKPDFDLSDLFQP